MVTCASLRIVDKAPVVVRGGLTKSSHESLLIVQNHLLSVSLINLLLTE